MENNMRQYYATVFEDSNDFEADSIASEIFYDDPESARAFAKAGAEEHKGGCAYVLYEVDLHHDICLRFQYSKKSGKVVEEWMLDIHS